MSRTAGLTAPRRASTGARLAALLLVVAVGWLGFRAVAAFDQDRHAAEAAAVVGAPDAVHHRLPPVPGAPVAGATGELRYRPDTWLTVVDLRGLAPVTGGERYLVFLRNWAGWTLAGAARPDSGGTAQVRSAAEPRPASIYEVVVARAVDDATSVPHGQPVLHWFEPSLAAPRARPFDFARAPSRSAGHSHRPDSSWAMPSSSAATKPSSSWFTMAKQASNGSANAGC